MASSTTVASDEASAKTAAQVASVPAAAQSSGRSVVGIILAGLIGVAAGYFVHPPSALHATFLNCDAESTPKEAIGTGWSGFEENSWGDSFMWCTTTSCTLKVHASKSDQVVRMRAFAFIYPDAPVQTLRVSVNGSPIGSQPVPGSATVLKFAAPKALWHDGPNELRLDFAYAESPKARVPGGGDPRTLSGGIDWLEVAPRAK